MTWYKTPTGTVECTNCHKQWLLGGSTLCTCQQGVEFEEAAVKYQLGDPDTWTPEILLDAGASGIQRVLMETMLEVMRDPDITSKARADSISKLANSAQKFIAAEALEERVRVLKNLRSDALEDRLREERQIYDGSEPDSE